MLAGGELWTNTFPDGLTATLQVGSDETRETTFADGTSISLELGPEPRFGMQSPVPVSMTVATGGHTMEVTTERTVTQTDPSDPLTVQTQTDQVTVNGRTHATTIDVTTSPATMTQATHAGRTSVTELDAEGRPTKVTVQSGSIALYPTELSYYDSGVHKGLLHTITQGAAADERAYELVYDSEGNLASISAPLGKTVTFGHDAIGRVKSKTFPDGERVVPTSPAASMMCTSFPSPRASRASKALASPGLSTVSASSRPTS